MSELSSTPQTHIQHPKFVSAALLGVPLLDEATTGLNALGIPLIHEQLGLSPAQVLWLFGLSTLTSMLLEPLIALLSDFGSKRVWILTSMLFLVLGYILLGAAHDFWLALIALCLMGIVGKMAIGLSQAALIDLSPTESTRAMTRWTLLAGIGDLLVPLLVPAIIGLFFGWMALCWGAALCWLLLWLILCTQRFGTRGTTDPKPKSRANALTNNLRAALSDPVMIRWTVLSLIPSMVDEVFQSVITLYLHDSIHVSNLTLSLLLGGATACSPLALFILDRWHLERRVAPSRLLRWLAILVMFGFILLLTQQTLWLVGLALTLINLGAAGWYPIAKGQAYARFPGRSGTVRAITSLGGPLEMALPNIVGVCISLGGIIAGIGILGLAPCFVLLLTLRDRKLNTHQE
ncbi:MFS transporter [Ktedonospora formicarum]|uniref:Major facilitator superfamily (MFS) profile domain-containing protein n=1 Tax=Ktedonospora formicarum TaxID=2778364 RepID=A0A8J3I103_9CHLR|nr:MFS transporter [Ktedonospora formicarum]GHO45601.1 hypothetical protein KSX_37640 [Ktedonospora formicarum]